MNYEDLKDPELQEKLKSAKTPKDILALAKEEGFELDDEDLDSVSGGAFWEVCNDYCIVDGPVYPYE